MEEKDVLRFFICNWTYSYDKGGYGKDKDSSLWKLANERNGKVSAKTSFDGMRDGDKTATEVVNNFIKYLACGITNVINIFQPDILCIGGGVCNEGDTLLVPVKELVAKEVYSKNSEKIQRLLLQALEMMLE